MQLHGSGSSRPRESTRRWLSERPAVRLCSLVLCACVPVCLSCVQVWTSQIWCSASTPALVAEQTTLPEFPQGEVLTHDAIDLVTASIEGTVGTMRSVHDEVDEADPTSADILHGIIEKLEQQAWFISAETRTPKER